MKLSLFSPFVFCLTVLVGWADDGAAPPTEAEKAKALANHQEGAEAAAIDQDKQSANVQELIAEQTNPKVIELLGEVELLMAQTIDRLEEADTGGDTIAMQTEIIEKIYEAAKAKASAPPEPGDGPPQPGMGAMLEMMRQMMGQGEAQVPAESEQGGEGMKADSNSANDNEVGEARGEKSPERRVPKGAGRSGEQLPEEFQRALDGYNKKTQD